MGDLRHGITPRGPSYAFWGPFTAIGNLVTVELLVLRLGLAIALLNAFYFAFSISEKPTIDTEFIQRTRNAGLLDWVSPVLAFVIPLRRHRNNSQRH